MPRGNQREKIRDVFLVPHHSDSISVYPPVIDEIRGAHSVIIGPGDLFTSIIPSLIVPGVKEILQKTRAQLLYIVNIMTKFGETHQFTGRDFVGILEKTIGRRVDGIIYNTSRPDEKLLAKYREQKAELVEIDNQDGWWSDRTVHTADLLDTSGGILRHDARKLASLLRDVLLAERDAA